ncbi:CYTH domain-containing protein [Flavobacteriaceae bacterium LSUCC0859]|nr:CYTH domain-containing protein [Flavobacteriaceae bacterium LSUCC0859]
MIEIERKFLVKDRSFIPLASQIIKIRQGFLSTDPERTVRVRSTNHKAWITVKGLGSADGTTRFEWEKELPLEEAHALLNLCVPALIEKVRYVVPHGAHTYEVDVFEGENQGLIVAELELSSAQEQFETPSWLSEEVTGDKAYYNASLSQRPFSSWSEV